jgi:hypothetical protein
VAKRLINFRIDTDLLDGLEAIRTRDGIPVSEQVRRAMAMWLEAKGVRAVRMTKKKADRKRATTR